MVFSLILLRHGPKDDRPEAHQTGIEAGLDPRKGASILARAANLLTEQATDICFVHLFSTPVARAVNTAALMEKVFALDPHPTRKFEANRIAPLLGSTELVSGKPVNLSAPQMSEFWRQGKAAESDRDGRETASLLRWLEVGFDETHDLSGISIREIACRIGSFVHLANRTVAILTGM